MALRRMTMYLVMVVIIILIALSIAGAFMGSQRAKVFFNSAPSAVYWLTFLFLLVAGLFIFPTLIKKPSLLLTHLGCILILLGGLWGSDRGHALQRKYLGRDKIPSGYMQIFEGQSENTVFIEDYTQPLGTLDFSIRLEDFSIEYYPPDVEQLPQLYILMPDEQVKQIDAVADNEVAISGTEHKVRIIKIFKRFRMNIEQQQRQVYDATKGLENPALEVDIVKGDGTVEKNYVFANHPGMSRNTIGVRFAYELPRGGMPKDYYSDLTVFEGKKPVRQKVIEVNKPLYYGGYHFYQQSYDPERQQYTVLSVTSDTGLYTVFTGYGLLALGVIWQCWFIRVKPDKEQS